MSASLLILVVLMTSFAADKWITNAQLSLPLFISAVCATATAAVGIPLLRRLKMGQFIREEGPKAHRIGVGPSAAAAPQQLGGGEPGV